MKRIALGATFLLTAFCCGAADFFSTDQSEKLFTFGARLGVNTANRTMSRNAFRGGYHDESWRTGFDLGVVAGINFRDYLSVQPGLFFDIYNSGYSIIGDQISITPTAVKFAQAGRVRTYNLTIPVMAVVAFNVTDDVRWTVEAGPYVSFAMGSKLTGQYLMSASDVSATVFRQKPAAFDFGFKVGTGIQIMSHYYVGAHYLAGCLDAWKDLKVGDFKKDFGGRTKAWVFTIGYNL